MSGSQKPNKTKSKLFFISNDDPGLTDKSKQLIEEKLGGMENNIFRGIWLFNLQKAKRIRKERKAEENGRWILKVKRTENQKIIKKDISIYIIKIKKSRSFSQKNETSRWQVQRNKKQNSSSHSWWARKEFVGKTTFLGR